MKAEETKIEYANSLNSLDYAIMNKTLDYIKENGVPDANGGTNKRFLPSVAEILDIYKQLEPKKYQDIPKTNCSTCQGEGLIIYSKLFDYGGKLGKKSVQCVARCDKCQRGNLYLSYPSISEVMNTDVVEAEKGDAWEPADVQSTIKKFIRKASI